MRGRTMAVWAMIAVLAPGAGMASAQQPVQQQDEGPILQPKPKPKPVVAATLVVTCDLACDWTLDGTAKGRIDAGASAKAKVSLRQHVVAASTEDALDKVENPIEVKTIKQITVQLALQPVREARLKAEAEARAKAEQEARDKAAAEAKAKADADAKAKADAEAKAKAEADAKAKAEQDARDKAFIEARDKASQVAQAKAEQEAHDKAVRDEWNREQQQRMRAAQPDNSGGVWTDPATGLMWTRKDNGYTLRWQPAVEYCRDLQLAGYSDWRLPSIDELKNIYNPNAQVACGSQGHMVCQIKGRIQLTSGVVWSSSGTGRPQIMRGFYFHGAGEPGRHVIELEKSGINYDRALCVRSTDQ